MEEKFCKKCEVSNPLTVEFYYSEKDSRGVYRWRCKACRNARVKAHRLLNRDRINKNKREARTAKIDSYKETARKNYWKNREKNKALCRAYYHENKEARSEAVRKKNAENPEANRERVKAWARANPEKARRQSHIKRGRKLKAIGKYSTKEFREVIQKFDWSCCYCGEELGEKTFTIDHAVPISKGGSNYIENLLPSCRTCNSSKNNKELLKWYTSKDFFEKERLDKILNHIAEQGQMALF